jgi:hypothetical protein
MFTNFNCKQFVNFKISRTVSNKTNEFIVHVVIYIVFLPVIGWIQQFVYRGCVEACTDNLSVLMKVSILALCIYAWYPTECVSNLKWLFIDIFAENIFIST